MIKRIISVVMRRLKRDDLFLLAEALGFPHGQ